MIKINGWYESDFGAVEIDITAPTIQEVKRILKTEYADAQGADGELEDQHGANRSRLLDW